MKMKKVEYHNRFSDEYITKYCDEHEIRYFWNEDGTISIPWCVVGDNFYDYEEEEPPMKVSDKNGYHGWLARSPLVHLEKCDVCCGCAGW